MSEQTKNKIFWLVLVLLIVCSIVFAYIRIFVNKDYMLVSEVSCDKETESCFVYTPEDLCLDSEDENCVENTESEYYKIIHKKAVNVIDCDQSILPEGDSCAEFSCIQGEPEEECFYEYSE